jgi:anti-sigma factor RsiW
MENINERPVCHRAEDLVTYLYGEANAAEARDFATHLEQCDACRSEFSLFNQVHESIVTWRNEALGTATVPAVSPVTQTVPLYDPFVQHERKLSAWASLREFFSVSPLWLRGATAFAGILLCALLVFTASRLWQRPTPEVVKTGNEPAFNQQNFDQAVQKEVDVRMAALNRQRTKDQIKLAETAKPGEPKPNVQAANRGRSKRPSGLNPQEREQLAADLGLIPGRDEELPFVLPEEPNR